MLRGLRVSWARPAAARFISLRCELSSLARSRRICSSEDLATFRQARLRPATETPAKQLMIQRIQRSWSTARRKFSVDMAMTRLCSPLVSSMDLYSCSLMPKGRRNGRAGRRSAGFCGPVPARFVAVFEKLLCKALLESLAKELVEATPLAEARGCVDRGSVVCASAVFV